MCPCEAHRADRLRRRRVPTACARGVQLAWISFGLCLLHVVAKTWATITLMRLARWVIFHLRVTLSRKLLHAPMKTLHEIGKHGLLAILTRDIETMVTMSHIIAPSAIANGIVVIACLGYLAWLSWTIFLVLTVAMLVVLFYVAIGILLFVSGLVPSGEGARARQGTRSAAPAPGCATRHRRCRDRPCGDNSRAATPRRVGSAGTPPVGTARDPWRWRSGVRRGCNARDDTVHKLVFVVRGSWQTHGINGVPAHPCCAPSHGETGCALTNARQEPGTSGRRSPQRVTVITRVFVGVDLARLVQTGHR